MKSFFLFTFFLWLAACAPASGPTSTRLVTEQAPPTQPAPLVEVVATATASSPSASAVPDGKVASSPTPPAAATATPVASATAAVAPTAGQTAEGAYYLGDPAAPVTIIDYSDFM